MANESDESRKRRREREDEEEEEKSQREAKKLGLKPSASLGGHSKIEELSNQIEVLVEQIDRLYAMYFQKIEKLPPIQKRTVLNDLINQLDREPKPTPQLKFKAQSARTKYMTYCERWDKKLKDLENGKLGR